MISPASPRFGGMGGGYVLEMRQSLNVSCVKGRGRVFDREPIGVAWPA